MNYKGLCFPMYSFTWKKGFFIEVGQKNLKGCGALLFFVLGFSGRCLSEQVILSLVTLPIWADHFASSVNSNFPCSKQIITYITAHRKTFDDNLNKMTSVNEQTL